jgi:simple sugar transport system substrate-binding protein
MKVRQILGVLASMAMVVACTPTANAPTAGGGAATGAGASPGATASGSAGATDRSAINIQVVTHGQASDPFWSVFKNGVDQGARDMGVTVEYNAPQTFDMNAMAQLIDAAVGKQPKGLVVSIPDATALGPSIQNAVAAGIPVISANSGSDAYRQLGVLTHVGQDEMLAGQAGGERLKAAGVTNALCINQEVGNAGLDARCAGFAQGLGGTSTVLQVDLNDQAGSEQKIAGALSADPSINGVMALGPTGAAPALRAVQTAGRTGQVKLATFDLSADVLDAIAAGNMEFAIDQQQFLQGYLPIVFLTYYDLYGLLPGGGQPVLTGPGFVTKDNVAQVQANTGTTR